MSSIPFLSRKQSESILANLLILLVCLFAMIPIATTVLISFKGERDIIRKPPIIFPCDTPTQSFDLSACRWATEGYERVIAARPSATSPLGFAITGRLIRTYIPNTLIYASVSSLLVVLLAGMSGYAFSRYRFRGHGALMTGILAIMVEGRGRGRNGNPPGKSRALTFSLPRLRHSRHGERRHL